MIKEHVLPSFSPELLQALGELTVCFRCLDVILADVLARCFDANKQPRGRRPVDAISIRSKVDRLADLAQVDPDLAAEYNVLGILDGIRKLNTARNDFLHGSIQWNPSIKKLLVTKSCQRPLDPVTLRSLCAGIDKSTEQVFFDLHDWAHALRKKDRLHQRILEVILDGETS